MAGIDWGQLGGIPAPRVVGSVPASPDAGANTMNSLIGGIAQGMQDAKQGQLTQQQIQNAQTVNAMNQIKLQQAQQSQAYQNNLNKAYQQGGMQGYYNALNPEDQLEFDGAKTKLEESQAAIAEHIANIQKTNADTRKTDLDSQDGANLQIARTFNTADMVAKQSGGKITPDQAYQQELATYPKEIRDAMPQHYTQSMSMVAHQMGVDTMQKMTDEANAKNGGADSTAAVAKPASNDFDKANQQAEGKRMATLEQSSLPLKSFVSDAQNARNVLDQLNASDTGPVVNKLSLNARNSKVQELNHFLSRMGFQAKTMVGLTGGLRLTATELKQLNQTVGTTGYNYDALKKVLDDNIEKGQQQIHDNWSEVDKYRKNFNSDNDYSKWSKSNPEPYNPETGDQDSGFKYNGKSVPNSALNKAREANPGMSDADLAKKYGLMSQ